MANFVFWAMCFVEKEFTHITVLLKDMVEIFMDEKKLLQIAEELQTKSGKYYVVPLPFKEEITNMPANRNQAIQRIMYLKRKILHLLKIINN